MSAATHYFVENFNNTSLKSAGTTIMGGFTSGTYDFVINSAADGVLSAGTFTLVVK